MTRFKSILRFVVAFVARQGNRRLSPIAFPPDKSSLAPFHSFHLFMCAPRHLVLLILLCSVVIPSHAVPITHEVIYTTTNNRLAPTFGAFTYDSVLGAFSNFIVAWDGNTFDLTTSR